MKGGEHITPNYVAKKSVVPVLNFWLILFFWLIIPLIIQIVRILTVKAYSIEIYDEKIVTKSGLLSKNENQSVFAGVYSVSISQTFLGRIFGYGDIRVDCPGKWDIDTRGIKNPKDLKKFLETKITAKGINKVIVEEQPGFNM